jgi:hypothetical protein
MPGSGRLGEAAAGPRPPGRVLVLRRVARARSTAAILEQAARKCQPSGTAASSPPGRTAPARHDSPQQRRTRWDSYTVQEWKAPGEEQAS